MVNKDKPWFVYLLECLDNSYYTGVTNDLEKRLSSHNKGTASKYTRSRLPVKYLGFLRVKDRSVAQVLEAEIKRMSRKDKLLVFKANDAPEAERLGDGLQIR